jgi:hypothetical protein
MVADDERHAVIGEERVDGFGEPARVSKLEAVAARPELLERVGEPLVVAPEAFRELPQDRPELRRGDERVDPPEEARLALVHVEEAFHVREIAARLDREEEAGRALTHPGGDRLPARKAVESRVHLDGVEELRVVPQPFACRQSLGIDALAPVRVVPTRAADTDRSHRSFMPRSLGPYAWAGAGSRRHASNGRRKTASVTPR